MTTPSLRKRGIGRGLMQRSLDLLKADVRSVSAYWSSRLPGAVALERLLLSMGWSEKSLDQCRVSGTAKTARDWAHRRQMDRMLVRSGWSFASQAELTDAQREEIEADLTERNVERSWRPFEPLQTTPIVPELSIIMYQYDRVVGWMTTGGLDNGDLWYYRPYNLSARKNTGALMPLIIEVNRRHYLRNGPDARWRWNTSTDRPDMLVFLERYATDSCDFYDNYWLSRLVFDADPADAVRKAQQVLPVG